MTHKGIGVSSGISIGKVQIVNHKKVEILQKNIIDVEVEVSRYDEAIAISKVEIEAIIKTTKDQMGEEHGQIFEAHLLMLQDPQLYSEVKNYIINEKTNSEYALQKVSSMFIDMFKTMNDEYMRERAADIKDVTSRVLNHLLGIKTVDLSDLGESTIIIADDLTPSDTATMDRKHVLGFITNIGGRTSHTAIMARTLEIPAIVGLSGITSKLQDGDMIIMDGKEGIVIACPSEEQIEKYLIKQKEYIDKKDQLKKLVKEKSETTDKRHIDIAANIGTAEDLDSVIANGADGIGLFRTEFLYMNSCSLPTEEEQYNAYKKVVEGMNSKEVIIRTLDIGGDKELQSMELPKEMNPFLGYRAIRICLDKTDIFKTQLRALLRASAYGKLKIMFPMISDVDQVKKAKALIEEVKAEIKEEGISYDENIQVGVMIEIPAAAMISDMLAKEVDFFSIGTNDLIQYTIAVDRMNEKISSLYDPLHPGVIRLIKMVVENAHKEGIKVGMCGEMAGELEYIPLLVGLGLDKLSMSASSILAARKLVRSLNYNETKELAIKY